MEAKDQRLGRVVPPALAQAPIAGQALMLLVLGFALLMAGCGNQQIRTRTTQSSQTSQIGQISPNTQVHVNNLRLDQFNTAGVAIITPTSITGQEEDKQALALAFTGVLQELRRDMQVVPLPETLSAINRAGLTDAYKRMYEDYRLTGIFERETLQKIGKVTGARYLAQLKLAAFRQESKGRWGLLGIRMVETKSSTIRLFLQIWDSKDGSVAWEGSQESTLSHESFKEEYVSMRSMVEESTRDLIGHFAEGK